VADALTTLTASFQAAMQVDYVKVWASDVIKEEK
jgi:hypothetical protein